MRKTIITLIMLVTFCFASVAAAAANPFSDVPANHWAYGAVKKLADAGIIDGADGKFNGDKTLTRYEIAQIVARAVAREDRANAANKLLINKLAKEFDNELKTLGVRVTSLENKVGPLKIDGWFKYRYENAETYNSVYFTKMGYDTPTKVRSRNEIWVNIANQFDGTTRFEGSLQNETASDNLDDSGIGSGSIIVKKAFMAYQAGQVELSAGRFFPTIGKGTLMSTPLMDGGHVAFANSRVSANLYAIHMSGQDINYKAGDLQYNFSKDFNMSLAYVADKQKAYYDSAAVGFEYKGIPTIALTGEYAVNRCDFAKTKSGLDDPYAYFIKAQYKGANPFEVGSTGLWVQYEKAADGFDLYANASPNAWPTAYNWSAGSGGGSANNLKGFSYGVETTLAQRMVLTATYNPLKSFNGQTERKLITGQLWYLF
ncbi:MAG: S-layer y domain protein [Firmicutes bacterium]|nr:S-layer y domain protein [Bacillota bacterium]